MAPERALQRWVSWGRGLALLLLVVAFSACTPGLLSSPAPQEQELVVFAAASLTDAFTEMGQAFEQTTEGVVVTFNFAGSQQLAQQLANGAPADAFAAANAAQMGVAVEAGRVDAQTVRPFALNRLVVVTPTEAPAGIGALTDLARPGLKLVLADRAVPAGQYTADFLAKAAADPAFPADYRDAVLANVVSYENNVRAVLAKVVLGEADAGLVYMSDVMDGQVRMLPIPDELNTVAIYPIAPVAGGERDELAQRFIEFVRSEVGQAILERYGFRGIE